MISIYIYLYKKNKSYLLKYIELHARLQYEQYTAMLVNQHQKNTLSMMQLPENLHHRIKVILMISNIKFQHAPPTVKKKKF